MVRILAFLWLMLSVFEGVCAKSYTFQERGVSFEYPDASKILQSDLYDLLIDTDGRSNRLREEVSFWFSSGWHAVAKRAIWSILYRRNDTARYKWCEVLEYDSMTIASHWLYWAKYRESLYAGGDFV